MIDDFARLIPQKLWDDSGLVFYSGRAAFAQPAQICLMGLNPGGDRGLDKVETVGAHSRSVMNDLPERWSSYKDGKKRLKADRFLDQLVAAMNWI